MHYLAFEAVLNNDSWVGVRLDAIGGLLAAALGAYLVYGQATPSAAEAGFSMTMIFGFSVRIIWSVRFFNEAEIAGNRSEILFAKI